MNSKILPTMVQAITVLTVLKMLTNAQTTCNHGLGRVVYERLPDHQLQGFDDDVVRDTIPPFRMLEKCQDLCLRDRTAINNLVRTCTSFNFQPGVRIASFSGTPEYEESVCYLTREQAHPEGIGNLVLVPNSVHFTEVCLSSSRIERECPNRRYVFERHPRKKLELLASDHKEVQAANRTDCEDRCLNEFSFVCRSVTYNSIERTCSMSRFTRRSHPELLRDDPNSDYLENTCLNAEKRCDGLAVFVKEENKRLGGPFEVDMYVNISLEECQNLCLRAEKYFCRSIEYDERRRECIVSEEDSVSQKDDLRTSSSNARHLFDLVCLDNPRGEFSDNSLTSHLFSDGRKPDTAFQRYRNARLGGEFHSEITSRTLSECLDECLRQASFQCRSAVYSERFRVCRLSRFNQRDGHRIIYDADYDYYENLMSSDGEGFGPHYRPDPLGQDTNYHTHGRPPFGGGSNPTPGVGTNYPGSYPGHGGYPGMMYPGNMPGYVGGYPPMPSSGGHYNGNGYPGGGYQGYPAAGGAGNYNPGYGGAGFGSDRYPSGTGYNGAPAPYTPHMPSGYGGGTYPQSNYPPVPPVGGFPAAGYPGFPSPGGGYPPDNSLHPNKFTSRCDEGDSFRQVGVRLRIRRQFVRRYTAAPSLPFCERECVETRDFMCRSFNYKSGTGPQFGPDRDNCELSDRDSRDLDVNNPSYYEITGDYDYYERSPGRQGQGDCLDVSQQCSEDGMEFALRTPEGFFGRIYTYGFYERCFFRGNGGTVNVLRISGAQGYPECGTQRYGDSMTNIVVVQFSDYVQTGRDKRYNLTCLFRGPGEAVVTSGYIGAGSGSPIPIEYLPAENSLSSKVRLMILYQNRPTTTIAVGDPLTFRLETQDGYNYASDIFATNVIARDPYSGRSVQLIDRYGCPVDNTIFPGLDRSREGDGLEARFNAFRIPESNFLVFEATVRTCRDGCQPAYCTGQTGRSEPSFGRRKREAVNSTTEATEDKEEVKKITTAETILTPSTSKPVSSTSKSKPKEDKVVTQSVSNKPFTVAEPPMSTLISYSKPKTYERPVEIVDEEKNSTDEEEFVREMIKVFDSRFEISEEPSGESYIVENPTVCLAQQEYYGLISAIVVVFCILLILAAFAGIIYRRWWYVGMKNLKANEPDSGPNHRRRRPGLSSIFLSSKFHTSSKSDQVPFSWLRSKTNFEERDIGPPVNKMFCHPELQDVNLKKDWNDTNFRVFEKTKAEKTGSIGRKLFEDLFSRDNNNPSFHVDCLSDKPAQSNFSLASTGKQPSPFGNFEDPSEPIYTDPTLFELERSRSLRSVLNIDRKTDHGRDEV